MSAVVQFASVADYALDTEERLVELVDLPDAVELNQRLDNLEGGSGRERRDEVATFADRRNSSARLAAFENRLARLELRQRRPVPLTVIQNHRLDPDERQVFLELQRLFNKLDRELKQHVTACDGRIAHYASQFRMIRQRLAAVERKGA